MNTTNNTADTDLQGGAVGKPKAEIEGKDQKGAHFIKGAIERKKKVESRFALVMLNGLVALAHRMKEIDDEQFAEYHQAKI